MAACQPGVREGLEQWAGRDRQGRANKNNQSRAPIAYAYRLSSTSTWALWGRGWVSGSAGQSALSMPRG
eukprot:scaffold74033_cov41-Tisochrysis_lutea.AAC.2